MGVYLLNTVSGDPASCGAVTGRAVAGVSASCRTGFLSGSGAGGSGQGLICGRGCVGARRSGGFRGGRSCGCGGCPGGFRGGHHGWLGCFPHVLIGAAAAGQQRRGKDNRQGETKELFHTFTSRSFVVRK